MRYLTCLVLSCLPLFAATKPRFFHKGVNFTAERGDYASETALQMLSKLKDYGVNSVALVPYGFSRLGSAEVRFGGRNIMERDESIVKLADEAHRLGLRVLLKPQIWTGRGFPGDIDFADAAMLAQWFEQYSVFIRHFAELATKIKADVFCVGVEFAKLTRHESEWRRIIKEVRNIYRGPLVYAAIQGPEFETLKFWDALDYIGLNNYYPLPDSLSTDAVVKIVEGVHRKFRKPVIFPEAGFTSLEAPHRQPWDETPRKISLDDQARAYEAVFRAFYNKPWFAGMYWWKIGNNGYGGPLDGSHTPWGKPAMEVIGKWFRRPVTVPFN